jgi:hypothetical protein
MNDVDAFGSLMDSFVLSLRDEYPKMTSVVFPMMSNNASQTLDIHDVRLQNFSQQVFFYSHAASGTENETNR